MNCTPGKCSSQLRSLLVAALLIVTLPFGHCAAALPRHFQESLFNNMRANGLSEAHITSQKEIFRAMEAGASLSTWSGWTNYYNAVVLNPPVTFDMRDPLDVTNPNRYDFTDPLLACRSYLQAACRGDGKTLLKYADATGTARLRLFVKDENATNKSYHAFSNRLTRVTLLLAARTVLSGKEYVMVFWRGQNADKPMDGPIMFQKTFFVKGEKFYRFTDDLTHSGLGDILTAANADPLGIWRYPVFAAKMRQSDLPPHFYSVE